MPDKKPNLHALLVGVNEYECADISNLNGCVDDIRRVETYLQNDFVIRSFDSPPQVTVLTDEEATKKNIIVGFEKELSKASAGDSVLFYFAGHGLREKTTIEVFTEDEFDGKITGIVCHDSDPFQHDTKPELATICDKEMRFLIHQLETSTKAKIVAIFDCCHSGENTRSLLGKEKPSSASRIVMRHAAGPRHPDGFYFGDKQKEILEATGTGKNLAAILPEGKHIQMAACKEVELAIETSIGNNQVQGVFSKALLEVLTDFEGKINYDDLHLRVLNRMSTYEQSQEAQTPQIYIKADDPNDRYRTFLSNEAANKTLTCNVVVGGQDGVTKEWRITAGALQAIPIDQKTNPSPLIVKSTKDDTAEWKATIDKVFPGYCQISFPDGEPPTDDATLYGEIDGLGTDPLKIFVGGPDAEEVKFVKDGLQKFLDEADQKLYEWIDDEVNANYTLYVENGILFTTPPGKHDKPLLKGIAIKDKADNFLDHKLGMSNNDLVQMANWNFLKKLEYSENHDLSEFTDANKTMFPVELVMYTYDEASNTESRLFPDKYGTFNFDLTPENPFRDFRVEIINHMEQTSAKEEDYHVSLMLLSNQFGATSELMPSAQMLLGPQGSVTSRGLKKGNGKRYIRFSFQGEEDDYVRDFNLDGVSMYFKLIVSRTPYEVTKLHMEDLPKPVKITNIEKPEPGGHRGLSSSFQFEPEPPKVQWEIHSFELYIQNPDVKVQA